MSNYANISLKLDREKDADIIAFLDGKPKSYMIKEALRVYMKAARIDAADVMKSVGNNKEAPKKQTGTDIASMFGGGD